MEQCKGITKNGDECKRNAVKGTDYCAQHANQKKEFYEKMAKLMECISNDIDGKKQKGKFKKIYKDDVYYPIQILYDKNKLVDPIELKSSKNRKNLKQEIIHCWETFPKNEFDKKTKQQRIKFITPGIDTVLSAIQTYGPQIILQV